MYLTEADLIFFSKLPFIHFFSCNKHLENLFFFFSELVNSMKLHCFSLCLVCSPRWKGVYIVQQCEVTTLTAPQPWLQHEAVVSA